MGETDVTGGSTLAKRTRTGRGAREGAAVPQAPRTTRAARTREAVVDALLDLLDEGNMRPTAREVADRAKVSLRSVYVHFDDLESLFLAAAVRHRTRVEEVRGELLVTGSLDERLVAFVERRARILELSPNVRRAGYLHEPFSPAIRDVLVVAREVLAGEIDQVFGQELASSQDPAAEASRRAAVVVGFSAAAWDDLRLRQKLSIAEAQDAVSRLVRPVLVSEAG